jgi:hypothetical protein
MEENQAYVVVAYNHAVVAIAGKREDGAPNSPGKGEVAVICFPCMICVP